MSIKSYISKIDYQLNVIDNRKRIARNILKGRMADSQLALLTAEQTAAVDRVWGSRKKMFDWRWFELYNGKHPDIGVDIWKFIPVDYWLAYIDPLYAKPTDAFVFDDKNMYDLYFPDVRQPKTIVRYIDGLFLDSEYHIISEEEAFERCQSACRVLIKPAVGSCGGGGIALWDTENGSLEELKQVFRANQCYIVQEVVRQHPVMASLNASSCNTIRMLSFLYRGEVVVIPTAYARIGGKGSFIDNVSSGGYFVGIGREGEVYDHAQDHHGRKVDISVQGSPRIIPGYHKCQEIARTAAPRLSPYYQVGGMGLCDRRGCRTRVDRGEYRTNQYSEFPRLNWPHPWGLCVLFSTECAGCCGCSRCI